MTADELQAQEMAKTAETVAELTGILTEQLKAVKPLTREQIDEMAKQAHETSPELQRLDAEVRQLERISSVFERKNGRKAQEEPEARQVQKAQDAQEVRQPV